MLLNHVWGWRQVGDRMVVTYISYCSTSMKENLSSLWCLGFTMENSRKKNKSNASSLGDFLAWVEKRTSVATCKVKKKAVLTITRVREEGALVKAGSESAVRWFCLERRKCTQIFHNTFIFIHFILLPYGSGLQQWNWQPNNRGVLFNSGLQ